MPEGIRHLVVAAILLGISGLAASGLVRAAWSRMVPVISPWQRAFAPDRRDAPVARQIAGLEDDVIHLNAEIAVLRHHLAEFSDIRGEGAANPQQIIVARGRVVSRTERQGRRFCELDAGAIDGVELGMAATVGWSLVGVVDGLQEGRCLIRQTTDAQSRIPAAVSDGTTVVAEGVLSGTGERDRMRLDFIDGRPGVDLKPGMGVVTSGLGGAIPRGLVLGRITSAIRPTAAVHWTVEVAPLFTADACDSLLVMKTAPGPAPSGP